MKLFSLVTDRRNEARAAAHGRRVCWHDTSAALELRLLTTRETTLGKHTNAWQRYRPSDEDPWDVSKVAHLHRRAGFSSSWKTLQRDLLEGPDSAIDRLLKASSESTDWHDLLEGIREGVRSGPDKKERLEAYWFNRLVFDRYVLREKMTLFWHDHFATSNGKVRNEGAMLNQNELLRNKALGSFSELLSEVIQDPALLVWLDATSNSKRAPNENLARELLELFMLGEGNYTEADVRNVARALTGVVQRPDLYGTMEIGFDATQHDDGAKTFLGFTGKWGPTDILRIGLQSGHAAELVCRKLYRFLVNESEPPARLLTQLAHEFQTSDYSIGALVATILRSKHFFDAANRRQKLTSPVDAAVGFLRAFDYEPAMVALLPLSETCARQGQHLFYPPNVGGWPGGKDWINSGAMVERTLWMTDQIWGNTTSEYPTEPVGLLRWSEKNEIDADDIGRALIDLTLQDDVPAASKKLILSTARSRNEVALRKALQLIVHCPAYHLS